MDQYITAAYNVTTALFGPDSGIPPWAWLIVLAAIMFKLMIPKRATTADRDEALVAAMSSGDGKKSKKKK